MTKPVLLRLDEPDYDRLEEQARALGMRPGTLARVLLRARLQEGARPEPAGTRELRLGALDRLTGLSRGKPAVDALRLVAEARAEFGKPRSRG
ncbi:MAG TPA: hypothetical protein VKU60_15190 [Chloroflexota bacterium]|nr:hypothetical protein [Chloroflexota bacterium]